VVSACDMRQAVKVVLERNFGGDLGLTVVRRACPNLPVKMVTESRGKHSQNRSRCYTSREGSGTWAPSLNYPMNAR